MLLNALVMGLLSVGVPSENPGELTSAAMQLAWKANYTEALSLIERAPAATRAHVGVRLSEARIRLWSGDTQRAIALAEEVLREQNDEPEALRVLAQSHLAAGDWDAAARAASLLNSDAEARGVLETIRALQRPSFRAQVGALVVRDDFIPSLDLGAAWRATGRWTLRANYQVGAPFAVDGLALAQHRGRFDVTHSLAHGEVGVFADAALGNNVVGGGGIQGTFKLNAAVALGGSVGIAASTELLRARARAGLEVALFDGAWAALQVFSTSSLAADIDVTPVVSLGVERWGFRARANGFYRFGLPAFGGVSGTLERQSPLGWWGFGYALDDLDGPRHHLFVSWSTT